MKNITLKLSLECDVTDNCTPSYLEDVVLQVLSEFETALNISQEHEIKIRFGEITTSK